MAEESGGKQKGAMFLVGMTFLQSLRVALTGARFALTRFQIPQEQVSAFINMVHNPMELAAFTGVVIVNVVILLPEFKGKAAKWCAVITNIALCLSFILLLLSFTSGGDMGNLTFYYWAIVLSSFMYGLNIACSLNVGGAEASFFTVGIPISGIQVCGYHYLFAKLAEIFHWSNISYWIIFWQIMIAILISAVSAIVWVFAYPPWETGGGSGDSKKTAEFKDFLTSWSPLLMGVVGLGGVYAFYPAIAPYKLTDVKTGYYIDLAVLFISAIPGIASAAFCLGGIGPSTNWDTATWWHGVWILAIPYISTMFLCLYVLHHPDSKTAKYIMTSGTAAGAITIIMIFCEEGLTATSYAGAATQVDSGKDGGKISTFNTLSSQFFMNTFAFIGDGYLKTYVLYENDRDKWPTKHYGTLRSFWFWTWSGMYVACKTVKTSFTTNVRGAIYAKKEYLFVVYTHG